MNKNHHDYIWAEAEKVALHYFKDRQITKSTLENRKKRYGYSILDVFEPYKEDVRERCLNEIKIPKFVHDYNIEEIEEFFGMKEYLKLYGLTNQKYIDMSIDDWSWDMKNNPNCVLTLPFFWQDVYEGLPSGKMSGHRTRAPLKKCPVKVDFRKML